MNLLKIYRQIARNCRFLLILDLGTLTAGELRAQGLTFEEEALCLDSISEDDDPRTVQFHFQNQGKTVVRIRKVETTCGCAQPHYKKEDILGHEKGTVDVTFYPLGRVGKIDKKITVWTDGHQKATVLTLTGVVTPSKDPYINYPYAIGPLRLMQTTVNFHTISGAQRQMRSIEAINSGEQPLTLSATGLPPYVTFSSSPLVVPPQQQVDLRFIVHPAKADTCTRFEQEFLLEGVGEVPLIQRTMTVCGHFQKERSPRGPHQQRRGYSPKKFPQRGKP